MFIQRKPESIYKILIIIVLFNFMIQLSWAQNTFHKMFGSSSDETGVSILMHENGNLILLFKMDDADDDFAIAVADQNLNILETKRYYIPGNQEPATLQKSMDGGYFVAGDDMSSGIQKVFLVKLNQYLEIEWSRKFSSQNNMKLYMVTEDPSGNVFLGGDCRNSTTNDFVLFKFNSLGNMQWYRTMGTEQNDHIYDIHFAADGNLICFGSTWYSSAELTMFVIDQNGVVLKQQSLFRGPHFYPRKILEIPGGDFVIFGTDVTTFKSFVIRMNADLQPVWYKFIRGLASGNDKGVYFESGFIDDNQIFFTGNSLNNGGDIVLVNMNTDGAVNWVKTYGDSGQEKITSLSRHSVTGSGNQVFLFGSTSGSFSSDSQCYLIKASSDGQSGCFEQYLDPYIQNAVYDPYDIEISKNFLVSVDDLATSVQTIDSPEVIRICPEDLQADFSSSSRNICEGQLVNFTDLSSAGTLSWNWIFEGGGPETSTLQNPSGIKYENPGSFKVTLMVSSGSEYDTIVRENYIQAAPLPQVNLGNDLCMPSEGLLPLFAGEGFIDYQWSNGISGSSWIYAVEPGIYWVTVTNQFGCVNTDSIEIYPGLDTLPDLGPDQSICDGQTISLNPGTAYYSYLWSDGSSADHLDVATPGIYWVKVSNEWGCEASDSITVTYGLNPVLNLGEDLMLCQLSNTVLDAGTGYSSYLWSNGSSAREISPAEFGTYWVRVTDLNGCQGSDTILIEQKFLNIDIGDTLTACEGEIISVDAGNSFGQYQWSNGGTTSLIEISDPGKYWIRVTDENQCEGSDTIVVLFSDLPEFERINRLSAGYIQVSASGGTAPYMYSDNGLSYQNSGEFQTTGVDFQRFFIRDARGCISDSLVYLGDVDLVIPNFFTPNDDFIHDTWEIEGIQHYPQAVINIFDRYGKLLASCNGDSPGWNGKSNGKEVPSDTYWFQILFPTYLKNPVTGHVTVKR